MKIDDHFKVVTDKIDSCMLEIVGLKKDVAFISEKISDKKLNFKFQFGLLWSAIGVIFIALVGLVAGKLV